MKRIFTVALVRELFNQLQKEEISFSRLVEILNETVKNKLAAEHEDFDSEDYL